MASRRVYNWKAPVHVCIYNRQCVGGHSLYKWKRPDRPPEARDPQPTDRASQRGTAAGQGWAAYVGRKEPCPDDGTRWARGRSVAGALRAVGRGVAICKGLHPERPFPQSMSAFSSINERRTSRLQVACRQMTRKVFRTYGCNSTELIPANRRLAVALLLRGRHFHDKSESAMPALPTSEIAVSSALHCRVLSTASSLLKREVGT